MSGTMLTRKNDLLKGKPVPLPLAHHQSQMDWPGIKPDLEDDRLAINHPSHSMTPDQRTCYMFSTVTEPEKQTTHAKLLGKFTITKV
jgi:hypothetical protein